MLSRKLMDSLDYLGWRMRGRQNLGMNSLIAWLARWPGNPRGRSANFCRLV